MTTFRTHVAMRLLLAVLCRRTLGAAASPVFCMGCLAAVTVAGGIAEAAPITVDFTDDGTFTAPSFTESGLTVSANTGVGLLNLNGIGVVGGLSDSAIEVGETATFTLPASSVDVLLSFGPVISNFTMEYEAFGPASLGTVQINEIFQPTTFSLSAFFGYQPMTSFTMTGIGGVSLADRLGAITFTVVPEPSSLVLAGVGIAALCAWRRRSRRDPRLGGRQA